MSEVIPHVVYHVAGMGNWRQVVEEQLSLIKKVGLDGEGSDVRLIYLGDDLTYLTSLINRLKVNCRIVKHDTNLSHCETFAILEVEKIAKVEQTNRPILYMHTKGVSRPDHKYRALWRLLMEAWVVHKWKENLEYLKEKDAVGVNWIEGGAQHFSGTFWMANQDWIRRLPDFTDYHVSNGLHRYTCEMWIGAAQWCNVESLGCKNQPFWNDVCDMKSFMPKGYANKLLEVVPDTTSSFGSVFTEFGSDKNTLHSYGDVYDFLFPNDSKESVKLVLEIGVKEGYSLLAWEKVFPNAYIMGLDIVDQSLESGHRSSLFKCDATNPKELINLLNSRGIKKNSIDLIVDDGSHTFKDQAATLLLLGEYLSENGVYVIEDIYPACGANYLSAVQKDFHKIDRRGVKGRFDDVLVIYKKGITQAEVDGLTRSVVEDIPSPW